MDQPAGNECIAILSRRSPVVTRVHKVTHNINTYHDCGPRGIYSGVLPRNLKGVAVAAALHLVPGQANFDFITRSLAVIKCLEFVTRVCFAHTTFLLDCAPP